MGYEYKKVFTRENIVFLCDEIEKTLTDKNTSDSFKVEKLLKNIRNLREYALLKMASKEDINRIFR